MNSKLKIVLIITASIVLIAFLAWRFVNKPTMDISNLKPKATYSCQQLIDTMTSDSSLSRLSIDQLIVVNGTVKSITKDSKSTTVELGDSSSMSSVICQIDTRYQKDFEQILNGELVSIKGKITSCNIDTELGLGSTIQLNFCSLNKNK